jgi:hypothetical protein
VTEPTTLQIYPGADGSFNLYDDGGESLGYRDGSDPKMMWIRIHWDDSTHRLTLMADPRMKQWPGGTRIFAAKVVGSSAEPKQIEFRGATVETRF